MDEQWYAVIEKKTGALVSVATIVANPLPDHLAIVEIEDRPTEPSFWNPETLNFELKPKGRRN